MASLDLQYDSNEISQLKAAILGLHSDSVSCNSISWSFAYALRALLTPSSLQPLRATTATIKSTRDPNIHSVQDPVQDPNPTRVTEQVDEERQWKFPPPRLSIAATHPVSQSGAPITMPDSAKFQVLSNGTPSDGDTQPASQRVYNMIQQESVRHDVNSEQEEGETGHIDLLGEFEQEADLGNDTVSLDAEDEDDDVELVSQDVRAEPFPETMRFQLPKTPHTQGTKRKRIDQGDLLQETTPILPKNPFSGLGDADVMGPSQIFQATQAQTSPHILNSDFIYERPSPNVNSLGRPVTSGSLSSPAILKTGSSSVSRVGPEPQANYISVKESQEARERRLKQVGEGQDDLSDDEFGLPPREQPQRRLDHHRRIGHERTQLVKTLPQRGMSHSPNFGHDGSHQDRQTARRGISRASELVVISDDAVTGGSQGNVTEDETEHEEETEKAYDDDIDELAEDNKENVEVPMTVSRLGRFQMLTSQSSPSRTSIRRRSRSVGTKSATQVRRSPGTRRSPTRESGSDNGTQPYAVRDSQSSQQVGGKGHLASIVAAVPSSSPDSRHVILQSQLSQKLRSPVLPSSTSKEIARDELVIQLPSSSPPPLQQVAPSLSQSNDGGIETEKEPGLLLRRPSDNGIARKAPSQFVDISSATDSPHLRSEHSDLPIIADRTAFDECAMLIASTTSRQAIPNSSQEPSSSGPKALSLPSAAIDTSSAGQSLRTAPFETAKERLSVSPSKGSSQRLQAISQKSTRSSPARISRLRTLNEIVADPSPPDPLDDLNLSDFDLLSKDDEDFQSVLQGPNLSKAAKKRRPIANSTGWKVHSSPPTGYGTPVAPEFSQKSDPIDLQTTDSQSSSLLSTPPSSQDIQLPSVPLFTASPKTENPDVSSHKRGPPSGANCVLPDSRVETVPLAAHPSSSQVKKSMVAERAVPLVIQQESTRKLASQTDLAINTEESVVVPDRILAHYKGSPSGFYPATCLGMTSDKDPRYVVRYDDGAQASVSAAGIKRLELKAGDVVKVILSSFGSKKYVVVGMQDNQSLDDYEAVVRRRKANLDDKAAWPEVDIYGHGEVTLSPKDWDFVGGNERGSEDIVVGLGDVYLTQSMWANIKDREYTDVGRRSRAPGGLRTSSERPSTPSSPSSRAKRGKPAPMAPLISTRGPLLTLFANMSFTLTNIHHTVDLERTKSLILDAGGKILEQGFETLFHVPSLHRITSPRKTDMDREFHLTRQAQDLGFTCLIADNHCRRAKYIQALALGIPCLATRWISDCVSKQRILPWSPYLLSAGDSTFLGGATRSRVLPTFPAETATLSAEIDQRHRLFNGTSVLLIMSKAEEESMRQHPLLTFALGPSRVAKALTIEAAARAVSEAQAVGDPWDWVFSYDREREVEKVLSRSAPKKRKSIVAGDGAGHERKTRVIGNEFVIQSLILGQLVDA